MIKFLVLLFVVSCAHHKPNYQSKSLPKGMSRITVYWPRQWQSQWGTYRLYANNQKLKILKNEFYYEIDQPPGPIEIKSHHTQSETFIVTITLSAKPNKHYFLKLDTQPKEVTIMSAFDDIVAVGSIASGMKSELKLKEGKGSWTDAKNLIDKEKAVAEMESKREVLGYHVLLPIEESLAVDELKKCCRE